jgi:hypothetical protein
MPGADVGQRFGDGVMPRIKEIFQNAEQVEVCEAGLFAENKFGVRQHLFEREKFLFQLTEQVLLLCAPLVNTAAPEFALLVAYERNLVSLGDEFLEMNIVQLETHGLNFVLDVTAEDRLQPFGQGGKKSQPEFLVEVAADVLRVVAGFKNDLGTITDDGHGVILFLRQPPDERAIASLGQIVDLELRAGKFKDAALDDAKGAPRELDQFNHAHIFNVVRIFANVIVD